MVGGLGTASLVQLNARRAAPKKADVTGSAQLSSKNAGDFFCVAAMEIVKCSFRSIQTQASTMRIVVAGFGIEDISALCAYNDIPSQGDVLAVILSRVCNQFAG
jgi:hypothetical protein